MYKTGHDLTDTEIRERYSQISTHISMPHYFYRYVAELVPKQCRAGRLLDIGCGNGYLLEQIAKLRPELELWGLEQAAALLQGTQSRQNGPHYIVAGSAVHVPFASSSFDVVTLTEVLEHVKEPVVVLRELTRLLKPEGRLLVTVPNMSAYSPFWQVAERFPIGPLKRILLPWEHPLRTFQPIDTAYEFEEIQQVIREARLTVERISAREFFPYLTTSIPVIRRLYARFAQKPADDALERVLPTKMAYRLVLQCRV